MLEKRRFTTQLIATNVANVRVDHCRLPFDVILNVIFGLDFATNGTESVGNGQLPTRRFIFFGSFGLGTTGTSVDVTFQKLVKTFLVTVGTWMDLRL